VINQEEINSIKQNVDLVRLVKSRGVKLRKNGKGYKGCCPFHEETKPSFSVNPEQNLWNCFGCDKGGDAIRFIELIDQVDFKEAVKRLTNQVSAPGKGKTKTAVKEERKEISVADKKLMARVVGYYQHTFTEDPRGLEYLENRGISDKQSLTDFGTGYVTGSLKNILPDDPEVIKTLKNLGILNKKGNETFYNCVVFPIYDQNGGIVNLYGRNIDPENGASHLYLAGSRVGIINRQAVKRSSTILLTESIIDGLTLYDQGFKNVIPAYGVNGLTEDHFFIFNRKVKEVYICFDSDKPGKEGAFKTAEQLKKQGVEQVHIVTLPDKDINIFFNRHTPEEFEQLLKTANPESIEQSDSLNKRKQTLYKQEEHGFTVGYARRQYQVKGIQRGDTQLKATIKVSEDMSIKSSKPFELTTIDLYSSRSRHWFAKLCADLLQEPEALIKEDLSKLLQLVEEWQPKKQKEKQTEISQEDKKLALSFLKNEDIFAELLTDFDTLGVTGEEINKLVGYLAATSRKLADPLSALIQSRSAAGKSTLQDAILSLIPDEEYIKYTRVTDQALFYKEEDSLVNKILAIEEAEGMGGAAYSIRNIQSAKKITVAATGKDQNGRMKTEEYTVNGPVCVMITTTATEIDQETASRFIFLTIDESTSMTKAIHRMQREAESLEGLIREKKQESITKKHHAAQRMLKKLAVVNPYAKYLSYPNHSIGARRDHKKYLGLIRAVAFLHQYQREVKTVEVEGKPVEYIEVTLSDIETANKLANIVLGQSMDELAQPSRTLLSSIYNMVKEQTEQNNIPVDEVFFTRRTIREYANWTDWQVRTHMQQLIELEYINARLGSWGKEYSYALHYQGQAEESEMCYLNLTSVEEIEKMIRE